MVNTSRKRDDIMPKLNKTQRYAIQWLNHTGSDAESISKELNLSVEQVSTIIQSNIESKDPKSDKKTAKTRASDLMITHTSGKKINSVAIMTKEASEVGDAARTKSNSSTSQNKGIFRPKK